MRPVQFHALKESFCLYQITKERTFIPTTIQANKTYVRTAVIAWGGVNLKCEKIYLGKARNLHLLASKNFSHIYKVQI